MQVVGRDETAVDVSTSAVPHAEPPNFRRYSTLPKLTDEERAAALRQSTEALRSAASEIVEKHQRAYADLAVIVSDAMTQVDKWRGMPERRRQRLLTHLACTGERLPAITFPASPLTAMMLRLFARLSEALRASLASTLTDPHRTRARRSCEHTDTSPAVLASTLVHAPGAPALAPAA